MARPDYEMFEWRCDELDVDDDVNVDSDVAAVPES
jgi:hypothetical protein